MYAERELSFEAIRAHSRDSSAHARHSAAVIIFISTSELNPTKQQKQSGERKHSPGVILKRLFCDWGN